MRLPDTFPPATLTVDASREVVGISLVVATVEVDATLLTLVGAIVVVVELLSAGLEAVAFELVGVTVVGELGLYVVPTKCPAL